MLFHFYYYQFLFIIFCTTLTLCLLQMIKKNKHKDKNRILRVMSSYMYKRMVLWFDKGVYEITVFVKRHAYDVSTRTNVHGEEYVKKLFSTAVIVNEDTHSNLVRGHCFTGEDTNIFHPWSLKLEGVYRKSTNISFYMVTNLFIYTTGSSHIIDDRSRAVGFGQSLIGL